MTNDKHDRKDEPEIISKLRVDPDREEIEKSLWLNCDKDIDDELPLAIKRKKNRCDEDFEPIDCFDDDGEVVGSISSDLIATFPENDELSRRVAMLVESLDNVDEDELVPAIKELGDVGPRAISAIPALLGVRRRVLFDSGHPRLALLLETFRSLAGQDCRW